MLRNDDFEDFTRKGISHSGIGLANILDSKMYQTGCKTCPGPPRRKPKKSDFRKFQPGPKHHDKDLYDVDFTIINFSCLVEQASVWLLLEEEYPRSLLGPADQKIIISDRATFDD